MKKFNKIMGIFNKVISKLENLAQQKKEEKSRLQVKVDAAEQEELAATEILNKLKALVTPSNIKTGTTNEEE